MRLGVYPKEKRGKRNIPTVPSNARKKKKGSRGHCHHEFRWLPARTSISGERQGGRTPTWYGEREGRKNQKGRREWKGKGSNKILGT